MIGMNIRQLRTERGWSQEELAEKVGVIQPAISQIESGATHPRYTTLLRLAEALGVTLDRLTAGEISSGEKVQ